MRTVDLDLDLILVTRLWSQQFLSQLKPQPENLAW